MPAVVADAIFGATTIRQVTATSHRTAQVTRQAMTSGGATVSQVSGIGAEPVTTVTSADLAGLVALNTNTYCSAGLYVSSGTVTVPYKARSTGGVFASGSNHPAISGTDALIIPTGFEASVGDENGASCTSEIHWISTDGTTDPAAGSTGNALASQAFNAEFSLGKVMFNAGELSGVQSVRITPGITIVKSKAKNLIYPTEVSIQTVIPMIEITTNDLDDVALCSKWTAMTSANVYFVKRSDSGLYVADITAEHIKFTFAAGLETAESVEASENSNGTVTITLRGKTLTASAASAIT